MSNQAITFTGKAGVDTYIAVALKTAIRSYARSGLRMNRAWTPTAMLAKASEITGTKFKRGQYQEAIEGLEAWLAVHGTNGQSQS